MKKDNPFMQDFEQLPTTLPLFPLANAVFLPGGSLPLNVFEPRYLNMVRDGMRDAQLIGMIQPSDTESPPALHEVGCAGRITRYAELDDGRLEIVLTGLCRFEIEKEIDSIRGYRIAIPDWSKFELDFAVPPSPDSKAVALFKGALRSFFEAKNIEADWQVLEKLNIDDLTNNQFSYLPLSTEDKQILIETLTPEDRLIAFTAILKDETSVSATRH